MHFSHLHKRQADDVVELDRQLSLRWTKGIGSGGEEEICGQVRLHGGRRHERICWMHDRNCDKGCVKMTQPVLMQSLVNDHKDVAEMHEEKSQQQPWIPEEVG